MNQQRFTYLKTLTVGTNYITKYYQQCTKSGGTGRKLHFTNNNKVSLAYRSTLLTQL